MHMRLWDGGRSLVFLEWHEPAPADHSILSEHLAESRLRYLAYDGINMMSLRAFLGERDLFQLDRMSDHDVLREISRDLRNGRMKLAEGRWQEYGYGGSVSKRELEQNAKAEVGPRTTWVEFQVVWADGGRGVGGVELTVRLPNGKEQTARTDDHGLIRIDGLDPGVCDLETSLRDVQLDNAVVMAATASKGQAPGGKSGEAPAPEGAQHLIEIEEHKVKTGETLNSIAQKANITWQHLAMFNWGTYDTGEINRHLFAEVGCRKMTTDGRNYFFDDGDEPGIVYLPKRWNRQSLATTKRHVIRVSRVEPSIRTLHVLLLDDKLEPMAGARWKGEGTTPDSGMADTKGVATFHAGALEKVTISWGTDTPDIHTTSFWIEIPEVVETAAQRRLDNLGFSAGPTLKNSVEAFQAKLRRDVTGRLSDIESDLNGLHDDHLCPSLPL